ncbi:hypothetical protein POKO110462_22040 [Pontibacter korlensis]|uniref:Uncharacterized protein n=1 Tax=Pontibacter korlensis TaxID=400092 RepID=A0A0E3ZFX0_9BACT|nr:hypothetical protein [Pontibacter korlensis]AKD04545.1 hypothetical protein PKOR_17390 [Pontibacter korlensis]
MRDERRDNYRDRDRDNYHTDPDARWLHGHHHGQNSDRGNFTVDTHFNRGYGTNRASQYGDPTSFNSNADQWQMYPQGRFQSGGAQYSGKDYTRNNNSDNPYGMTYVPNDDHNSGRHYDPQADYSDRDYDDLSRRGQSDYRYGLADERFGHDVRRGDNEGNWARGSRGDDESYRRYEHRNRMYDNDYSTGFAGRNYARGEQHYREGQHYSDMDTWQGQSDQNYERYMRDRDRR